MNRRTALKVAAVAALSTTMASAYEEKLIVNKNDVKVKDPANPTDFEAKHLPDIKIGDKDAKGFSLVTADVGQRGIIHPSVANHWIYEIELYADDVKVASVDLEPVTSRGYLATKVNLDKVKTLKAVSKCNLHGNYTATLSV